MKRQRTYSWEIIDYNIAIKTNDQSIFKYNGSSISKDTRWFWGIENLEKQNRTLILEYKAKTYKRYIEQDLVNDRTSTILNHLIDQYIEKCYPKIRGRIAYENDRKRS